MLGWVPTDEFACVCGVSACAALRSLFCVCAALSAALLVPAGDEF